MTDAWFRKVFGDDEPTRFGSGWASGVGSVFLGALGLGAVACLHFPAQLTFPEARAIYPLPVIRGLISGVIAAAILLGVLSSALRRRKVLGVTGAALGLVALALGGGGVPVPELVPRGPYLGLDWFLLNLFATVLVFFPVEFLWPLRPRQGPFRPEWTLDTTHFFANHAFVQLLSFLILLPATGAARWLGVPAIAAVVGAWPFAVQFVAAILVADLAQYAVHRTFHVVPALWRIHAIHHSIRTLDWLAGSRFHPVEIVLTRGLVLVPLTLAGFSRGVLAAYLGFVALHAVFIHANFRPRAGWLEAILAMPRFHHWHHAAHEEAIDRNFAVHLPVLDRLFGTFHMPGDAWPERYGLLGDDPPPRYLAQVAAPFRRRSAPPDGATGG